MKYEDFLDRYTHNPKKPFKHGGQATIFKGYDQKMRRDIAIKRAEVKEGKDKYSVREEFRLAKTLKHNNLAEYYDVYRITTDLGTFDYGIMEFIAGGTRLSDFLKTYPDDKKLKTLLIDVLKGIKYLHQNKVIHRDLKPSNILIKNPRNNPVPKIIDFGISKNLSDSEPTSSVIPGTPEYLSPEQLNEEKVDYNTDLWTFGVIVYYIFTGELPFGSKAEGHMQDYIFNKILEAKLPTGPLNKVQEPYKTIIKRCLVRDVTRRIQTVDEVLDLLQKESIIQESTPISVEIKRPPKEEKKKNTVPVWSKVRSYALPLLILLTFGMTFMAISQSTPFQYWLGKQYESGIYLTKSYSQAEKAYQKAANAGKADAQYRLGKILMEGYNDLPKNEEKALDWMHKAADQEHAIALKNLGMMYREGIGTERDDAKSFTYYKMAAERGLPDAMNTLGTYYCDAIGTDEDHFMAVHYYRKAAEHKQEHGMAQFNLGKMFKSGRGVERIDKGRARYWFNKAKMNGIDTQKWIESLGEI